MRRSALTALLAIIDRFAEMMVHPDSSAWARFIVREQMEPTAAFDLLYGGVMGRLVDHLSALIVRIGGGHCDAAEARLKTLAIVGQALVFRVARATLFPAPHPHDPSGRSSISPYFFIFLYSVTRLIPRALAARDRL